MRKPSCTAGKLVEICLRGSEMVMLVGEKSTPSRQTPFRKLIERRDWGPAHPESAGLGIDLKSPRTIHSRDLPNSRRGRHADG